MNSDDLSNFLAEIMAREDCDEIYMRVRAGAKTAKMDTVASDIVIPDTLTELFAVIEEIISRAGVDDDTKVAYVEAVRRGVGTVVSRLTVRLDADDGTLNLMPTKGTDAAGILAIQLVRSSEAWERGFDKLLRQHFTLIEKHAKQLVDYTALVTDATARAEVQDDANVNKMIAEMVRDLSPALNMAIARYTGATGEEAAAVGAAAAASRPTDGSQGPAVAPEVDEGMTEADAGPIIDQCLHAFEVVLQKRPTAIFEAKRLMRLQRIGQAVQDHLTGGK